MIHKSKRLLAATLAGVLLLGGCANTESSPASGTGTAAGGSSAMGRYVEEKLSLPENMWSVEELVYRDGAFSLLGYRNAGDGSIRLGHYTSTDGNTWQEVGANFDPLEYGGIVDAITYVANEDCYYAAMSYYEDDGQPEGSPEEGEEEEPAEEPTLAETPEGPEEEGQEPDTLPGTEEEADEDEFDFSDSLGEFTIEFVRFKDGQVEKLPQNISNAERLMLVEPERLIATHYYGDMLTMYDFSSGSPVFSLPYEDRLDGGYFDVVDGMLAVSVNDTLTLYDAATGQQQGQMALETGSYGGRSAIRAAGDSAEDWYYANASGIYKLQKNGALSERIMDGSLSSLALPTHSVNSLFLHDNDFFVLCVGDEEISFYRYYYDSTVPTTPGEQLRVYSLEDSPTLRLAANVFQRQNPNVQVQYEYGYADDSGQTVDDALKALAAQVMAENGPDVIVMDGLPLQTYVNRGVLMDIGGYLDDTLRETLYQNIAFPGAEDDEAVYTVAGRFAMPMLFAQPGDETVLASPETLADYLAAQEYPLFGYTAQGMIEGLYPLYSGRWLADNYRLNEDNLREDLAQLRRIAQMQEGLYIDDYGGDMFGGSILSGTLFPVYLAELKSINELVGPYTNAKNGMPHVLYPLPSAEAPIFRPLLNMGVVQGSKQPELATAFIACVLGEEVQGQDLEDGLPVNRASMEAGYQYTGDANHTDAQGDLVVITYGWGYSDPKTGEYDQSIIQMYWPKQEYIQQYALWEDASAPLWEDRTVLEILDSECTPYLLGQTDLDGCIQALAQRLNLLAAENE